MLRIPPNKQTEKASPCTLPFVVRQPTHPLFLLPRTLISSINPDYGQVEVVADSGSLSCEA